jgi:hypothetical protein
LYTSNGLHFRPTWKRTSTLVTCGLKPVSVTALGSVIHVVFMEQPGSKYRSLVKVGATSVAPFFLSLGRVLFLQSLTVA